MNKLFIILCIIKFSQQYDSGEYRYEWEPENYNECRTKPEYD